MHRVASTCSCLIFRAAGYGSAQVKCDRVRVGRVLAPGMLDHDVDGTASERRQIVRLPLVAPVMGHARVEHRLMCEVGLALDNVGRRWSEGAERSQYFLAGIQVTAVERDEQQHIGATQMFRNPVESRRSSQVELHGKLTGRRRYELAIA